MAGEETDHGPAVDPLQVMIDGLEFIAVADRNMALSCFRTFLILGQASEQDGKRGIPVLMLAKLLHTPRTNVTRNLKYLREQTWVSTEEDPNDRRIDLSVLTPRGWEVFNRFKTWPRQTL